MENRIPDTVRNLYLRSVLIGLAVLVSVAFIAAAASAQTATPTPSPVPEKEVTWGGYRVSGASELGWRWRSLSGNENKYRSDFNYKRGLRSFDSNLLLESDTGKGKIFDSLLLSTTGWGSDPTGSMRMNMERIGLYKFNADIKRVHYFNNLFNFVNPVPFPNSEHFQNIKHTFGDFDVTILPQNETIRFTAGLSFNKVRGPGGTTDRFFSDEFPIDVNTKTNSTDLRVGVEGKLFGFDWGLSQGFRSFNDRSLFTLGAPSQGNNPTNQSRLDSLTRTYPIDGNAYFTQFHLHRTIAERLDFTGRAVYSSTSTKSRLEQFMTGRDNTNPAGILVTSDIITNLAQAKRPQTRVDIGLTYAVTDKFRLSNTFTFDQFTVNGGNQFQEVWTKASGATLRSTTISSGYRVNNFRRYMNTFEGDYQFNKALSLHIGYRYSNRRIFNTGFDRSCTFTTGVCTSTTTPINELETNTTNAVIAGMRIRPVRNWTIFWDVEHGQADNVFTRLENYKYTNFRVRSRVNMNKFSLNLSAISKDNENPSKPKATVVLPLSVSYITSVKNRFFSGSLDWDPMERLSVSTGYTYHHLTSYTPIALPISGAPGGYAFGFSQYFMRDHYVFFDVSAKPVDRLSFYASYRLSLDKGQGDIPTPVVSIATPNLIGSYPMQMQSPEFRAVFRITDHLDWNVGYQYYDYKDAQTPFMNYRAHLPYVSLRYYFGGNASARR